MTEAHAHAVARSAGGEAGLRTPFSVASEHREIHAILGRAVKESGALGDAARALDALLGPHFRREEEIATPPLALLIPLSRGPASTEMRAVLPMTDALERELPQMLEEHHRIRAALERFEGAARQANHTEYIRFSHTLAAHARQEEEILYPAAVLVGRYVARETSES